MILNKNRIIVLFYVLFFILLSFSLIYVDLTTPRSQAQIDKEKYAAEMSFGIVSKSDKDILLETFSNLENYPLYLPQYIQNVKIINKTENISFYTVKTTLISTNFLVKQTIDKNLNKQLVEILNGSAKNSYIEQTFYGSNPVNIDTTVILRIDGILAFISHVPHSVLNNHIVNLAKDVESFATDMNSIESQIDLLYREILKRPVDSNSLNYFYPQISANQLTYDELRKILYDSDEYHLLLDPTLKKGLDELKEDTKKTINDLYVEILYRQADIPGLIHWGSLLESNKITVDEIREFLINSDEKKSILDPNERKKITELKTSTRKIIEETYQEILLRHADVPAMELYGSLLEANKTTIEKIRQILYDSSEYKYRPDIPK